MNSGVSSSAVEACGAVAAIGLSVVLAAAIPCAAEAAFWVSVLAAKIVAAAGVCVVAVSLVVISSGAIHDSLIGKYITGSSSSSVSVLSDKDSNLTRKLPVPLSCIPPSWKIRMGLTLGSSSIPSDIGVANKVVTIVVTRCANCSAIISSRPFFYRGNLPW